MHVDREVQEPDPRDAEVGDGERLTVFDREIRGG